MDFIGDHRYPAAADIKPVIELRIGPVVVDVRSGDPHADAIVRLEASPAEHPLPAPVFYFIPIKDNVQRHVRVAVVGNLAGGVWAPATWNTRTSTADSLLAGIPSPTRLVLLAVEDKSVKLQESVRPHPLHAAINT